MKIKSVSLKNFTVHDASTLTLPDTGIVLVTGPNGRGKSSFLEGVATALWGKTLRGTSPWRDGTEGSVIVETDSLTATRKRSAGGKTSLDWGTHDEERVAYETSTKAQEALEDRVGSFDNWRRTSVLSSADASTFTLATDAERKRLLETLLGLDKFDTALEACKADLKKADLELSTTKSAEERRTLQLAGIKTQLDNALAALGELPEDVPIPEGLEKQVKKLLMQSKDARAEASRAQSATTGTATLIGELQAKKSESERRAKQLQASACPTCQQPIPQGLRDTLAAEVTALASHIAAERIAAEREQKRVQLEVKELNEEADALDIKRQALAEKLRASTQTAGLRARLEGQKAEALKAQNRLTSVQPPDLSKLEKGVNTLKAVSEVLGTKGVRAHVLGEALKGIDSAANAWLSRISDGTLSLELKAYTEKKTGGTSDSISLTVNGAGGGTGYRGASGGERRRIDVALLLGLAEVAQAASGSSAGTLFLDEVADALDTTGVAAVCEALQEMAQSRAVVVITHNAELIRQLQPAHRVSL